MNQPRIRILVGVIALGLATTAFASPASVALSQAVKKGAHIFNPGTVGGVGAAATYVMADLEQMSFAIREVPPPKPR